MLARSMMLMPPERVFADTLFGAALRILKGSCKSLSTTCIHGGVKKIPVAEISFCWMWALLSVAAKIVLILLSGKE